MRLGRGAVDLVGEHQVGEQRAGHEGQFPRAAGAVFAQHLGAGDVAGHQVGSELDTLERPAERVGEGAHQQGLGHAGWADQQRVAAAEQSHQQGLDHRFLPDHPAGDGLAQLLAHRGKAGKCSKIVSRQRRGRRLWC